MIVIAVLAVALSLGGHLGVVVAGLAMVAMRVRRTRRRRVVVVRPVLLMLLVELRSGLSVLASLHSVARRLPDFDELQRAVRIATVAGLPVAAERSTGPILLLLSQLARAQASGSSAADSVRKMLESDIARERSERLARTRALPVKLMIPVTLLILPGVILLGYGPTLINLLNDVVVPFG